MDGAPPACRRGRCRGPAGRADSPVAVRCGNSSRRTTSTAPDVGDHGDERVEQRVRSGGYGRLTPSANWPIRFRISLALPVRTALPRRTSAWGTVARRPPTPTPPAPTRPEKVRPTRPVNMPNKVPCRPRQALRGASKLRGIKYRSNGIHPSGPGASHAFRTRSGARAGRPPVVVPGGRRGVGFPPRAATRLRTTRCPHGQCPSVCESSSSSAPYPLSVSAPQDGVDPVSDQRLLLFGQLRGAGGQLPQSVRTAQPSHRIGRPPSRLVQDGLEGVVERGLRFGRRASRWAGRRETILCRPGWMPMGHRSVLGAAPPSVAKAPAPRAPAPKAPAPRALAARAPAAKASVARASSGGC